MVLLAFALIFLSTATATAKHSNQGYIYGKVSTRSGNTYTGLLRWDDEEAFWDDLFHSYKENRPYGDYLEKHSSTSKREVRALERTIDKLERKARNLEKKAARAKDRDAEDKLLEEVEAVEEELEAYYEEMEEVEDIYGYSNVSVLGGALNINWNEWSTGSRIFICRFGDIKKIEVIGSEDAELTMKNGSVYTVSGYSNDVGGKIVVEDNGLGQIELDWRRIDMIEFMDTPKNVEPVGYRLHGTLFTDAGEFKGYIQWDSEECLSTDVLDGDSEDGELSLAFKKIRSIERRSKSSSYVTLKDGRRIHMEGSNDVDGSIRGIMIEDARYGRMKVPWDSFDKLVLDDKGDSGMGYNDYVKPKELSGTITDEDGNTTTGRIIFDLDEGETWEILNGDMFDVEFNIPFGSVKIMKPRSRNSTVVELRNGESLRLEGGQDVTQSNDGVLVFDKGEDDPTYIRWGSIEKIEFK